MYNTTFKHLITQLVTHEIDLIKCMTHDNVTIDRIQECTVKPGRSAKNHIKEYTDAVSRPAAEGGFT